MRFARVGIEMALDGEELESLLHELSQVDELPNSRFKTYNWKANTSLKNSKKEAENKLILINIWRLVYHFSSIVSSLLKMDERFKVDFFVWQSKRDSNSNETCCAQIFSRPTEVDLEWRPRAMMVRRLGTIYMQ